MQSMAPMRSRKRRLILGVLAIFLPAFLYRVFAVYTVRSASAVRGPTTAGSSAFRRHAGLSS